MSESHDKIIADKESKIAILEAELKAKQQVIKGLSESMAKAVQSTEATSASLRCGATMLTTASELATHIALAIEMLTNSGNRLISTMRETKAAMLFEAATFKETIAGARQFKDATLDLRQAVETIDIIRPAIRRLMDNPEELETIKNMIHACAPTIHRERSETSAGEQAGPAPDVQER